MTFTNEELFNCCTNNEEPDWNAYLELTIIPVAKDQTGRLQPLYRSDDASTVETWTIFAQDDDVGMEWHPITDAPTARIAIIARELERRSNLPVHFKIE